MNVHSFTSVSIFENELKFRVWSPDENGVKVPHKAISVVYL